MPAVKCPQTLALVLRILLGAWFAFSGGEKIFGTGLDKFTQDVANYQLLGAPWDGIAAYGIAWTELVAGVLLMLGVWTRGGLLVIAGLVAVFAFGIGHAWSLNLKISCGCRGGDEVVNYWGKVGEFTVYAAAIAWLWWMECRGRNVECSDMSEL